MKKIILLIGLIICFIYPTVYAANSTTIYNLEVEATLADGKYQDYEPPLGKAQTGTENIDTMGGGMTRFETDVILKGKNGLDFPIQRKYISQDGENGEFMYVSGGHSGFTNERVAYKYKYTNPDEEDEYIYIGFCSEEEMLLRGNTLYVTQEEYEDAKRPKADGSDGLYGPTSYKFLLAIYTSSSYEEDMLTLERVLDCEPYEENITIIGGKITDLSIPNRDIKIGYSWELVLPRINSWKGNGYVYEASESTAYWMGELVLENGASYSIMNEFYSYESRYDDYKSYCAVLGAGEMMFMEYNDVFDNLNKNINGYTVKYNRILTTREGKKYYFNLNGDVTAVVDRYGNAIIYGDFVDSGNGYSVKTITDSIGREIKIFKSSAKVDKIEVWNSNELIYKIDYELSVENDDMQDTYDFLTYDNNYVLDVNKWENTLSGDATFTTRYVHEKKGIYYNYNQALAYGKFKNVRISRTTSPTVINYQYLLREIEYPTGLKTQYEYAEHEKYLNNNAYVRTTYRLVSRCDVENNVEHNKNTYEYEAHDYAQEGNPKKQTGYFTCTITREADNFQTVDKYNYEYQLTSTKKTSSDYYEETRYTYRKIEDSSPPTGYISPHYLSEYVQNKKTSYKSGDTNANVEYNDYNIKGDLLTHKEGKASFSAAAATCVGVTNNYTYDDAYGIVLTDVCQLDEDTWYKKENTLSSDGKSIIAVKEYESSDGENYQEKSSVAYTYDSYGNIASVQTGNVNTEYTYAYDGDTTITQKSVNLKDADESEISDVIVTNKYDAFGNIVMNTDANGNVTNYTYDYMQRLTGKTNPDNSTASNSYDSITNTLITKDEGGREQKICYTPSGEISKVYLNIGASSSPVWRLAEEYSYDSLNRPTRVITYNDYSSSGTALSKLTTNYTYTTFDMVKSIKTYNTSGTQQTSESYSYTFAPTLLPGETSADTPYKDNCITVTITRSGTDEITQPTTTLLYNRRGQLASEKVVDGSVTYLTTYHYDNLGRLLYVKDNNANQNNLEYSSKYEYDILGNVVKEYNAYGDYVENTYDTLSRLTSSTDYMGNTTNYTYDGLGRQIKVSSPVDEDFDSVVKSYYDGNGNLLKEKIKKNANGASEAYRETNYSYDNRNRVQTVTNGVGDITRYEYDTLGNVTKLYTGLSASTDISGTYDPYISPYALVSYEYDSLGRLVKMTDAMGDDESYTYFFNGQQKTKNDKNGIVTTFTYDPLNRLTSKSASGSTISYTYDKLGNLKTMSDTSGTTTYGYDNFSRLISETRGNVTKEYTYDRDTQNRTSLTVTNGEETLQTATYSYDDLYRIVGYTSGTVYAQYQYNENSALTKATLPGEVADYTYTDGGMVEGITFTKNGVSNGTLSYTYYADGNVETYTRNGILKGYIYDNANRLIREIGTGVNNTYGYDCFGNRIEWYSIDNTILCTYNKNNMMITEEDLSDIETPFTLYYYDANGNMIRKTKGNDITENTYDVFGRLTGVSQTENGVTTNISYTYDGNGLRQSKAIGTNTTTHIWDGSNIIGEVNGNITSVYHRAVGLVARESGTTIDTYRLNAHGDVIALGSLSYDYDAFGNQQTSNTNDTNPFRYCGEYFDDETGQIYLRARYYDPSIGRFINEDPIRDGLNWYVYCGDNPIVFVDPNGLEYIVVSGGVYSVNKSDYPYNFIEPAIKKLNDLAALNDGQDIKWIIADEGWTSEDITKFNKVVESVSDYYGANVSLKMIKHRDGLINYINTKDDNTRKSDKIEKLIVFSHGLRDNGGVMTLGFNYSARNLDLDVTMNDIKNISSEAFDNPNIWLGACNLATEENSFAKALYNKSGGKVWAFKGKSDYGGINNGQCMDIWASRKFNGFSLLGSANYPVAGRNAQLVSFPR